jgi:hypothetical protein
MRAEILGVPPVPTGLTWVSGRVEFSWDSLWSDDVGRPMSPAVGILQPTTRDKFVVPSSLGALFVPATPTGTGVLAGPPVTMTMYMVDSAGLEYRNTTFFKDGLTADSSNQWNVNEQVTSVSVTNPGTAPVGLTIGNGDARYVPQTQAASTGGAGIVQLATAGEAIAGANATKAITASTAKSAMRGKNTPFAALGVTFAAGFGRTGTVATNSKVFECELYAIYDVVINVNAGGGTNFAIDFAIAGANLFITASCEVSGVEWSVTHLLGVQSIICKPSVSNACVFRARVIAFA